MYSVCFSQFFETSHKQEVAELTLAQVPEEDVEEGDIDWLMAAAVLLDLTQNHLAEITATTEMTPVTMEITKFPSMTLTLRCTTDMTGASLPRPAPSLCGYLYTAGEDAGGHLLVEAGILLTVGD